MIKLVAATIYFFYEKYTRVAIVLNEKKERKRAKRKKAEREAAYGHDGGVYKNKDELANPSIERGNTGGS